MKNSKLTCVLLAAIMMFALCACSSGKSSQNANAQNKPAAETKADAGSNGNSASKDSSVKVSSSGGNYIFTVDPSYKIKQESWMGICPAGKSYKTEGEADEDDIIWMNPQPFEEGKNAPYEFHFNEEDIKSIEDGDYTMVLCEDDDVETSKCYLYFPITIKGSTLTADFSKIVIN